MSDSAASASSATAASAPAPASETRAAAPGDAAAPAACADCPHRPAAAAAAPLTAAEALALRNSRPKCEMTQARVAYGGPYRVHVLFPPEAATETEAGASAAAEPAEPAACDCGRQHVVFGRTYRYCTCGLSKNQPFCDDSHAGTSFEPLVCTADKRQTYLLLCGCKRTSQPPWCDGEHVHLTAADLQW